MYTAPEKVALPAACENERQAAPLVIVTVGEPELASKKTSSTLVGADAPAAPPELADQLVVFEESQRPEPPTQYLLAIYDLARVNEIVSFVMLVTESMLNASMSLAAIGVVQPESIESVYLTPPEIAGLLPPQIESATVGGKLA